MKYRVTVKLGNCGNPSAYWVVLYIFLGWLPLSGVNPGYNGAGL
jgi:hypothetical protein